MTSRTTRTSWPTRIPASSAHVAVILEAVLCELGEVGFGAMTIEGVAARAGVGKSTIYRHWPGKLELVEDAFRTLKAPVVVPRDGTLRERVTDVLRQVAGLVEQSTYSACMPALIEAAERDPRVRAFHNSFSGERRAVLVGMLRDAVDSGELPSSADPEVLADALVGPILLRHLLLGQSVSPDEASEIVEQVLPAAPPAKRRRSSILLTTRVQFTILRWQARPMGDLGVDSAVEPVDGQAWAVRRPALARLGDLGPDGWLRRRSRAASRWGGVAVRVVRPPSAATTSAWPPSTRCRSTWRRSEPAGRPRRTGCRFGKVTAPSSKRWCGRSPTRPASNTISTLPRTCRVPMSCPQCRTLSVPTRPPPFPFWNNFESRPLSWIPDWPPPGPLDPIWQTWLRLLEWDPGADPWLDAARSLLLVDLPSWPSGSRPHAWSEPSFIAPTLDVSASFHRLAAAEPWLLVEGTSPVAADALMGWTARLWTTSGSLVASGGGQTLFRPVPG